MVVVVGGGGKKGGSRESGTEGKKSECLAREGDDPTLRE